MNISFSLVELLRGYIGIIGCILYIGAISGL